MLKSIRSNNHRELSKAISHIENDQDIVVDGVDENQLLVKKV